MKRTWSQNRGGRAGGSEFKRPRFSGFFGPNEGPPDEEQVVEVGLLVRLQWVGLLIGKKGVTIKELHKRSDATMNFGNDDIEVDQEKFQVMAISGTRDQVTRACVAIAEKLGEVFQSEDWKLVLLIPNSHCGMFIGKKGSNVKKMKGGGGEKLSIKLSESPLKLPGVSEMTTCTIYGSKDAVKKAIEMAAITLGDIHARMQQAMKAEEESMLPPPSYGGGFGQSRGGPPSYGGGFRGEDRRGRGGGGGYRGGFSRDGDGWRRVGEAGGYGRGGGGRSYGRGGGAGGYGDRGGGYSREGLAGSPVGRGGWGSRGGSRARRGWGGGGRN